jgi:hypothetical protein
MMLSQLKIFSNEEKEALKHKGQANLISSRLIKLCKCTDHNDPNVIDYGNYHLHNEEATKKAIEKPEPIEVVPANKKPVLVNNFINEVDNLGAVEETGYKSQAYEIGYAIGQMYREYM